ncbi:MAG: 3-oxoacyl-ACP synthase [Hydrogenophaga sp.]|jgi:acyl-CoA:acyl-CoA alkyltransferase|uniref:3-oxoacyl-[acyl-carrier-protein] synthase III C-terminal domain-containing protein n=1 Tax=Hydrogenophaga sp. TaxID=1904254 RepID=UPI002627D99C|nr:3-oxoacyl-[acyl-carrier-protein] synthase III C-terminal domain-containing protein [Hydrogenophaga sp.]MCW5671942.1 3-oxoacyl-ACP synthase [Hydrogenophaga sp.]
MIIENVVASFPTRTVSNEEVIDLIRFHSKANFEGDLPQALNTIQTFLDQSGLITRQWQAQRERPIDHLEKAVSSVRSGSALKLTDIDLFIYVGVGRGFREPGNSYMAAKALGITRAECFDVIDAGMSWTRALSLVDSLFSTSPYRNALVVNAEFNVTNGGSVRPGDFVLQSPAQVNQALVSYTIGEAATATLLRPEQPDNFQITIHSRPDLADVFMVPNEDVWNVHRQAEVQAVLGTDRLTVKQDELGRSVAQAISHLVESTGVSDQDVDIVLTHTSPISDWQAAIARQGLSEKAYRIYPRTGNIVSASIPAALAMATEEGRLKRDDRVLFLMGSSGMSFAAGRFEHRQRSRP